MKKNNFNLIYIGLGKMGFNMVEQLLEKGYHPIVFDKDKKAMQRIKRRGASIASSAKDAIDNCLSSRLIWIMVPYKFVDQVIKEILPSLSAGDTIIDGGNSPFNDSIRRAKELNRHSINFLDIGVSGGPFGARHGACMMVGGDKKIYTKYQKLFKDLSVHQGYAYMGSSGAGHFVKMVHNGIEYGMMQSIAEGFSVMEKSKFKLNLLNISKVYSHGSVIESALINWLSQAFKIYGEKLNKVSGSASATGEGAWTIHTAHKMGIPVKIIEGALKARKLSQQKPNYQAKIISALRNMFGGHSIS